MSQKLVPLELTKAMEVAGIFAAAQHPPHPKGIVDLQAKRQAIYRAQILAAPIPEDAPSDELVKAAEELHSFLKQLKPNMHNWLTENNYMHLMNNLRAALDKVKS